MLLNQSSDITELQKKYIYTVYIYKFVQVCTVPYLYPAPFRLDERTCNGSLDDIICVGNHDIHGLQKNHYFCRDLGYLIHCLTTLLFTNLVPCFVNN
jgi:hypothetical protein